MENFTVYKHTNLVNGKCYIGITCQHPFTKRFGHEGNYYSYCPYFWRAIKKYGWNNFSHEIILENLTKEQAKQKEIKLIKQFDLTNHKLGYNLSLGGDLPSEEMLKNHKVIKGKEHYRYGKHCSQETKNRISETKIGSVRTEQAKRKTSITIRAQIPNILQYTKDYIFIKEWDCMRDIENELGFKYQGISRCCRKLRPSANGYIWRYEENTGA